MYVVPSLRVLPTYPTMNNSYWTFGLDSLHSQNLESISEEHEDEFLEEKLISKAERRFDELCQYFGTFHSSFDQKLLIFVSAASQKFKPQPQNALLEMKTEFHALRHLLIERARLKIGHFYEAALTHTEELLEEARKIHTDQRSLIENLRSGYLDKFKPHNTYFDEFSSLCATLRMHTTHWIQAKQMILTNRWYYADFDRHIPDYATNLTRFHNVCRELCRWIDELIDNGIYVLCRVSEEAWLDTSLDDYGQDFFSTFDHLNHVHRQLRELERSISGGDQRLKHSDFRRESSKIGLIDQNPRKSSDTGRRDQRSIFANQGPISSDPFCKIDQSAKSISNRPRSILNKELGKSTPIDQRSPIDLSEEWTLEKLFDRLSTEDGKYLAQRVIKEFGKKIMAGNSNSKSDAQEERTTKQESPKLDAVETITTFGKSYLSINVSQTPLPKIQSVSSIPPINQKTQLIATPDHQTDKHPSETSDYYSSSASSSKTLADVERPELPPRPSKIDNIDEFKKSILLDHSDLPKKLRRQLQNFYSNFLENRYSTFNLLLEEGAKHKSLHRTSSEIDISTSDRSIRVRSAKKSVKWLDDTLKQNKKQMWRKYVEKLWSSFLGEWIGILIDGRSEIPSARLINQEQLTTVVRMVLDTLLLVQLPRELSPCDEVVQSIRRGMATFYIDSALQSVLLRCVDPKSRNVTRESTSDHFGCLTQIGSDISVSLRIAAHFDFERSLRSLKALIVWHTLGQSISNLASYDLIRGYAMPESYLALLDDDGNTKLKDLIHLSFKSKLRATMKELLIESFPPKKYWKSTNQADKSNNEYIDQIQSTVLEPVIQTAKLLPVGRRGTFYCSALDETMRSWLHWIKGSDIRFSRTGAAQLRTDMQSLRAFAQSQEFLSQPDKDQLSNMSIFLQASIIADILEGKPINLDLKTHTNPVAIFTRSRHQRWRHFKVGPETIQERTSTNGEATRSESNKTDDAQVVILRPELQIWEKYRKRTYWPHGCSCFN